MTPSDSLDDQPFAVAGSWRPVLLRFAAAALIMAAFATGSTTLLWLSVPVLLWLLIVVWGHYILFSENLRSLPDLSKDPNPHPWPAVTLIVPVRNEADGIEPAARALAALDYPRLQTLIVDDRSIDSTLSILHRVARELPQLTILSAPELPEGWTGKTHASTFAFNLSNPASGWILFTDARVVFTPPTLRRAVAHAEAARLDYLSCILRFDGQGFLEESIALIQNRVAIRIARGFNGAPPETPFGYGAFMLVRRSAFEAIGGYSGFSNHPVEDYVLAKRLKRAGRVTSAAIAADLASIRRYHGYADMRRRVVRGMRLAAQDCFTELFNRLGLEFLMYVLPAAAALSGVIRLAVTRSLQPALVLATLLAILIWLAGSRAPRNSSRICRVRPLAMWLYPLGSAFYCSLLAMAITDRARGFSLFWRGRPISV
jgi:cellulose synthase/poly-beta-1,6-N-acetylglucosamine synthase-like glycosyltransferase